MADDGSDPFDLAVVGAGFGGLGMALRGAELGMRVVVLEALTYPGGCASTYRRGGAAYESGATLFAGLGAEDTLRRSLSAHGVDVPVEWLDPVYTARTPGFSLPVPRDRAAFVAAWQAVEPDHHQPIARFFAFQERIARLLWRLFEDPELLPPLGLRALTTHALRVPRYLELVPLLGRSLGEILADFGLARAERLRAYLDALCQITVQVPAGDAEASFALAAIDYPFRNTGHVRGGIGVLARGMVRAIEHAGGSVRFTTKVHAVARDASGFVLRTRRGAVHARMLGSNLLPDATAGLFGARAHALGGLGALDDAVKTGWGAVMLYRRVAGGAPEPHHLDLTLDPGAPLIDGNHVFCSVGAIEEGSGLRSVTCSTHVSWQRLDALSSEGRADFVDAVQARMRRTIATLAPELEPAHELTASPRTFERFVGRGPVGGIPRRTGFANYEHLGPTRFLPGAYLVGDSVFPGQSVLATALGGARAAVAANASRRG